ncbi:glutamine-hydrolyzing GMP synthase, partial [Desulfobulbus sp.]|uniref:glutamine-hydrolyzing GMP synthase n=1 Tax=Desulfobulbus sp. TaxID=895 RepID=UPI00286F7136
MSTHTQKIVILDFGSQTTQLIARRIREQKVYSEIHPYTLPLDKLAAMRPTGIVLSGGPASVYDDDAPISDPGIYQLGVPVLGICYGAQLMALSLGGEVGPSGVREYGRSVATVIAKAPLLEGLPKKFDVLMSHGDRVTELPPDCVDILATEDCPHAGFYLPGRNFYGLQFHPEVHHTPLGGEILENFLYKVCGCRGDWLMADFAATAIKGAKERVGDAKAVMGISGGVDSTVTAVLLSEALGDRLTCVFVDTGLLRKGEFERVVSRYGNRFKII